MNCSPVQIPTPLRVLVSTALIMLTEISGLYAQVLAMATTAEGSRQGEKNIHIQWSSQDESKWHEANDGSLDIMSLKTSLTTQLLHPSEKGNTVFQFVFDHPCTIECLVKINVNDPSESIYLYDKNTGHFICDLKPAGKSRLLTPSFNPLTTEIIWSVRDGSVNKSDIIIENIYYDPISPSRNRAIGFNTALPCHPNAACKTDSLSKLISDSDVRIRLVMEEGIGWCSGTMINTTRNDKTPFLLSAYHCTYDFTPYYDMWRFDFNYRSIGCQNPPTEPTYFSLTGCALKASGQASDFLLVLLDQAIPVDQEVTFSGWDRDPVNPPDTTYLVHHPNADIRKISTCTNVAVIHPNQIGWSEGYSTPANHHFRVRFTEGGHEKGSSGGGAYNQDFHLIGQLHGGTAGCEDVNSSYIGRFTKSWELGPTPPQQLKSWLDPDNTGLTTLESIQNISSNDFVDLHGVVKDPMGRPMKNVTVHVSGSAEEDMITDSMGQFSLPHVSRLGQFTFTPEKDFNPVNGLNVFDLLAIQKHLLSIDPFVHEWQMIAGDATNNGQVSVGDIALVLKLILGKIAYFPSSASWRFNPPVIEMSSLPPGPQAEMQIMGIKIGDVNGTADPSQ